MVEVIEHTGGVDGKLPDLEDKLLTMKGQTLSQMTAADASCQGLLNLFNAKGTKNKQGEIISISHKIWKFQV
jgi:hypothetical protein